MSLISDTDYLIHNLRLSYLREADDPYGPRIITLDPSYQSNPYIVAASLADVERWPELAMPSSPHVSDDDGERPLGFPGARGLKSSHTIMGGRTGGLGLRVHGKRASTSKRMSGVAAGRHVRNAGGGSGQGPSQHQRQTSEGGKVPEEEVKNFLSDNAPVQQALSSTAPVAATGSLSKLAGGDGWVQVASSADPGQLGLNSQVNVQVQGPTMTEDVPVTKVVQFVPNFKGAAEMEARRRVRMAARRGPGGGASEATQPIIPQQMAIDFDSSDEEELNVAIPDEEVSSSSDEFEITGADSMDEGDEFDPEFAATRTAGNSDSASDIVSVFSMGTTSNSSAPISSSHTNRTRARLSPVDSSRKASHRSADRPSGSFFEMLTPGLGSGKLEDPNAPSNNATNPSGNVDPRQRKPDTTPSRPKMPTSPHNHSSTASTTPDMTFSRRKLTPIKPLKSALSAMLAASSSSSNPFAEMYAAISGRAESQSTNVQVYFPPARNPAGKKGESMELNVRKDATVEEVIGFALWTYWEEGWTPKLDAGLEGDGEDIEKKRETKLSAIGWILRIAEDDGEVDDDFPPPDRTGKIAGFNSEAYAVLEANTSQIQQNQILESKIQRRPSRTTTSNIKKPSLGGAGERLVVPGASTAAAANTFAGSAVLGSTIGSVPLPASLGPSSSRGPQIFLRIRVADTADAVHVSTTIPVSAGMYMQEALEAVCRKAKLMNPKDYALLLADRSILIPLDRTVASLQGKRELLLIKRSMLPGDIVKGAGKTTDPNASIFKTLAEDAEVQTSAALDYEATYKKYTIYRKLPMMVTRQERTLAVDGDYIHIMPTNKAKAVFDSGKTASYHIKSIADCQQSSKSSSLFKLVLNRGGGNKRYDFEAENAKLAAEIVQTIRSLKAVLERSGTVKGFRRSRQVG